MRPKGYKYIDILKTHLGNDFTRVFDGKLIYPRQLEVHLPGDGKKACNFNCYYCQGRALDRGLGKWEEKGLALIEKLKGVIPYYIYGGAYTEPLMNKYLLDYLILTKKYNNNFGIHTNGSLFLQLENEIGFCSKVTSIADSTHDYISTSLDAGCTDSHCKTKSIKTDWFSEIIKGIELLVRLRGDRPYPSIRVCYLMNKFNSSEDEIAKIVKIMKDIRVDSLRFSVPYDLYGKDFEIIKRYKKNFEIPFGEACEKIIETHLSTTFDDKPYIFWHPPTFQDVEKMCFRQCIYNYYQITYGADGQVYRCSSSASPTFDRAVLGKVTDDIAEFDRMVIANANPNWDASTCFKAGARCNRIALEINVAWDRLRYS